MDFFELSCLLIITACVFYLFYRKKGERKISDFVSKFPADKIKVQIFDKERLLFLKLLQSADDFLLMNRTNPQSKSTMT